LADVLSSVGIGHLLILIPQIAIVVEELIEKIFAERSQVRRTLSAAMMNATCPSEL
jgi:hypothetical protein